MKATLLGYSRMKGTSKKTGKPYDGYMLHLGYTDDHVEGTATSQLFVDSSLIENMYDELTLGGTYDFNYEVNFSGYNRLVSVELC